MSSEHWLAKNELDQRSCSNLALRKVSFALYIRNFFSVNMIVSPRVRKCTVIHSVLVKVDGLCLFSERPQFWSLVSKAHTVQ